MVQVGKNTTTEYWLDGLQGFGVIGWDTWRSFSPNFGETEDFLMSDILVVIGHSIDASWGENGISSLGLGRFAILSGLLDFSHWEYQTWFIKVDDSPWRIVRKRNTVLPTSLRQT
jgi:hypothetical protein